MPTYRQIFYHIIFRTKRSEKTIPTDVAAHLYKYIWGIVKNKGCVLLRINGMEDHLHLFSDLHPSIALSDYVRDIKVATSHWMKESEYFPRFNGWATGYCALTYSSRDKEMIINYIKNQQEHHKLESFEEELRRILQEEGLEFDERFFLADD